MHVCFVCASVTPCGFTRCKPAPDFVFGRSNAFLVLPHFIATLPPLCRHPHKKTRKTMEPPRHITYAYAVESFGATTCAHDVYDLHGNKVGAYAGNTNVYYENYYNNDEDYYGEHNDDKGPEACAMARPAKRGAGSVRDKDRKRVATKTKTKATKTNAKTNITKTKAEEEDEEDEWTPFKAATSKSIVLSGRVEKTTVTSAGVAFGLYGHELNSNKLCRATFVLPTQDVEALRGVSLGPCDTLYEDDLNRLPSLGQAARMVRFVYYDGPDLTLPTTATSFSVRRVWTGTTVICVPSNCVRAALRDRLAEIADVFGLHADVGLLIAVVGLLCVYKETKPSAVLKMAAGIVEHADQAKLASTADVVDVTDALEYGYAPKPHQVKTTSGRAKAIALGATCFKEAWRVLFDGVMDATEAEPNEKKNLVSIWNSIHNDAELSLDKRVVTSMFDKST